MKHTLLTIFSLGLIFSFTLTGCDDADTESTEVEIIGGFEESQSVDDLDENQINDFCTAATSKSSDIFQNAQSSAEESLSSVCALQAVAPGDNPAQDEAACEEFVITCVANYAAEYDDLTDQVLSVEDCKSTEWSACSITVGEFSQCMHDLEANFSANALTIDKVTCAWAVNATNEEILQKAAALQAQAENLEPDTSVPTSCASLNEKCPGFSLVTDTDEAEEESE